MEHLAVVAGQPRHEVAPAVGCTTLHPHGIGEGVVTTLTAVADDLPGHRQGVEFHGHVLLVEDNVGIAGVVAAVDEVQFDCVGHDGSS